MAFLSRKEGGHYVYTPFDEKKERGYIIGRLKEEESHPRFMENREYFLRVARDYAITHSAFEDLAQYYGVALPPRPEVGQRQYENWRQEEAGVQDTRAFFRVADAVDRVHAAAGTNAYPDALTDLDLEADRYRQRQLWKGR